MFDNTIIEIQGNIIGIEKNISGIQETINSVQKYINSLHGDDFDMFEEYATIVYSDSYLTFPNVGNPKNFYVDTATDFIYRWNDSELKYYILGKDYNNIKFINGGDSIV